MAAIESKRSSSRTQHRTPTRATSKRKTPSRKTTKRKRVFLLPKPIITKRGKTTIRRYPGRSFHRFEEAQGKPVDYIEFFTVGEFHSIAVRFQDKTAMHFGIDPGFTLEAEYADCKTGNWRPIKRWPLIRSESHRA